MSAEKTIYELKKPFTYGSEEVKQIELKEPTAKEMSGIKIEMPSDGKITVDIDTALKVIKASTTEPPPKINQMKASDVILCYAKCLELFFSDTV